MKQTPPPPPRSNSLTDLAVAIRVEHEVALWSATVRVPQNNTYYFHYPWNPNNKVRGPSRTKELLPFGNLPFGGPLLTASCAVADFGKSLYPCRATGWRCTFTKRLKSELLSMLAIRPAGCILGRENQSINAQFDRNARNSAAMTFAPLGGSGNPRGPYAPSSERARFSAEFIGALLRDFRQGGAKAIERVRRTHLQRT